MEIESEYLTSCFDYKFSKEIIDKCVNVIKNRPEIEGIVLKGLSGMLIGIPVAHSLQMPFAVVRCCHGNHSPYDVEGCTTFTNYVIIDDIIDEGNTIKKIKSEMRKFNKKAKLKGIILYNTVFWENNEKFKMKGVWLEKV